MGQFNDFIIGDYADNYENLPLKTFTGYKYINEYCSSKGGHERSNWQPTNFIHNSRFSRHWFTFEPTFTSTDMKWILLQDDDTIIDDNGFNLLLDSPNSPVGDINCLDKLISNQGSKRSWDWNQNESKNW